MEEIWKDIPGYEGYYQASNTGRIRCVERIVERYDGRAGRIVRQRVASRIMCVLLLNSGYLSVCLNKEGAKRRYTVHRLVASAFIDNLSGAKTVNHKNGIRTDNRVDNLEWCSQKENILHASRVLRTMKYHGKPIRCVETGETFKSIKEASRHYGVADTNLGNSIRGKGQTRCAGYHWEFI